MSNQWILYETAGYLVGKGLNYSSELVVPEESDVISIHLLRPSFHISDLSRFSDESWNFVVIGTVLENHSPPVSFLYEFAKKLAVGGHIILITKTGFVGSAVSALSSIGSWVEKHQHTNGDLWVGVYKKVPSGGLVKARPRSSPSCLVVRYGAIGDMIMITPLLRLLATDGYHVTVNCTPYSLAVLDNNPHVHNIVVHERGIIPNTGTKSELGPYWDTWKSRYDRYINLSESIEGRLLKTEGRRDFYTSLEWRNRTCSKNYYDYTMELGGYPNAKGLRGEIYFNEKENDLIRRIKKQYKDRFLVVCSLCGTSHHKVYPLMPLVLGDWLDKHDDAFALLLGDNRAKPHVWDHPRVVSLVGKTSIREMFCYVAAAHCVVGPETSVTNAAGALDRPVITMLSHSGHDQLCCNFKYDYCLAPDPALAPCYGVNGCHQLHYTLESCPRGEIYDPVANEVLSSGPLCAMGAITGERLQARLDEVYSNHHKGLHGIISDRGHLDGSFGTVDQTPTTDSRSKRVAGQQPVQVLLDG